MLGIFTRPENAFNQTCRSMSVGGLGTLLPGALATRLYLKQTSFKMPYPLLTSARVAILALPLWSLYDRYSRNKMPKSIRSYGYEAITLAVAAASISLSSAPINKFLVTSLLITHISWRLIGLTDTGKKVLGLI